MLSKENADTLISIISSTSETLNDLLSKFSTILDLKTRVICLKNLSLLLSDGILDHQQQIVAFWILFKSFEVDNFDDHPFKPLFSFINDFRMSKPNTCSPELYSMLSCILGKQDISICGNYSVKNLMNSEFPLKVPKSNDSINTRIQYPRITPLLIEANSPQAASETKESTLGKEANSQQNQGESVKIISHNEAITSLVLDPSYSNDFEPPFIRPVPELSPIFDHELEQSFVLSDFNSPFIYDESQTAESLQAAKETLKKAIKQTIDQNETRSLCCAISSDATIAKDPCLTDSAVISLVEKNPQVAIAVIKSTGSLKPQLGNALSKLVPSANVCEVVKAFVKGGYSNSNFIRTYCSNAIAAIRDIRDNNSAAKAACPFCELMSDLIKSGTEIDATLTMTLLSACDDFRKRNIKEAASLKALLHTD